MGILVVAALVGGGLLLRGTSGSAMEVVRATRGPAVQAVYATGTVEPTVMMPIAARSAARLMELNVDEGADVKKGQVLGSLEDSDLQSTLEGLRAKEKYAAADYDRKKSLLARKFETQSNVDQARSNLDAAHAEVSRVEAQAAFLKLVAPEDGRIIRRDGERGELIPANQPVFWLSCCAPLRVSAEVDEEDIAQVKQGQKVLVRADAFPGKIFHGEVQSITPKGDPVARSYRVRIGFTEDVPLQIGMTAETNIVIRETQNALLLPNSAVQDDKVWVVQEGDKLHQQPVSVGAKGPDKTEITGGLTETDAVVLKPDATTFTEGKTIKTFSK